MQARSIYLSCAAEDRQAIHGLQTALERASCEVISQRPEAIRDAWRFVACFSSAGGAVRYDHAELKAAVDHARTADRDWLVVVKLQKCHLPILPIDWHKVPTIHVPTDWDKAVERITGERRPGTATTTMRAEELGIGGNLVMVNAEVQGSASAVPDARQEFEWGVVTIDGDATFKNTVVTSHRPKRK